VFERKKAEQNLSIPASNEIVSSAYVLSFSKGFYNFFREVLGWMSIKKYLRSRVKKAFVVM